MHNDNWLFAPQKFIFNTDQQQVFVALTGETGAHQMNDIAHRVLQLLMEPHSLASLTQQLASEYDVTPSDCQTLLQPFIDNLVDMQWLVALDSLPGAAMTQRYLNLLKKALVNWLYPEHELQIRYLQGAGVATDEITRNRYMRDIRMHETSNYRQLLDNKRQGYPTVLAHTLIGLRRLHHLEYCARQLFADQVAGDFFEAGVCQGGALIFLRALQIALGESHRKTWGADSFQGLPAAETLQDEGLNFTESAYPWLAISQQTVQEHFQRYELWDQHVQLIPGWFENSLPSLDVGPIALLRLDADLYKSTMDVLDNLYDKVSAGGFIIVDDYGAFTPCKIAIDEFRAARGISAPLQWIDWTGVFWRKDPA